MGVAMQKAPDDDARMNADAVQVIVQSMSRGEALSSGAAVCLASDAEYRLREIIQDSVKFMKHSKRVRLSPQDVNAALRLRNVAQTFGFNRASKPEGQSLVRREGIRQKREPSSLSWRPAEGLHDLYYTADNPAPLRTILEGLIPPLPLDVTVSPHWLAINGVQPIVPQNPLPKQWKTLLATSTSVVNELTSRSSSFKASGMEHILSKELQLYFDNMVGTLTSGNAGQTNAVLVSVAEEPGLVQLLPYFVRHVTVTVRDCVEKNALRQIPILQSLTSCMRLVHAMLKNSHFSIESYLHKLLPVICTCVVGRRLYQEPREDHWQLRDFSSLLLREICKRFREKYGGMQSRLSKTFLNAFADPKKSVTTHYGAIVGLSTLGKHVVDATILPHSSQYISFILNLLADKRLKPGCLRRFELCKVLGAFVYALAVSQSAEIRFPFSPASYRIETKSLPDTFWTAISQAEIEFGKERIYPHRAEE